MGDLELVQTPIGLVDEANGFDRAIFARQLVTVTQTFCPLKHRIAMAQKVQHPLEFIIAKWLFHNIIVNLQLLAQIAQHRRLIRQTHQFIAQTIIAIAFAWELLNQGFF